MKPIPGLVSVITPVYNAAATLQRTIDSVKAQTYRDWELILVDDASADDSVRIAQEAITHDKRIHLIRLTDNRGAAVARNLALDAARGQYIAFLDADDSWDSTKLSKQLDFMKQGNYAFTYTAYRTTKGRILRVPEHVDYQRLITDNVIGCLTVVIDRNQIGDFQMPLVRKGQDHLTWLSLLKPGRLAYGLNDVLATYSVGNAESLSGNKLKAVKRQWNNYRKVLGFGWFTSVGYLLRYAVIAYRKHRGN
jgi:teichuronic acid biosynthesis glycosyltransferase TuaG